MRQEYLRAAAEAFANINAHQADCYHYLGDGFGMAIQSRLIITYSKALDDWYGHHKYTTQVIITALSECQYPINPTTGFAWSGNQRAAFAGIAKATWSRNQLCKQVNFIIDDMRHKSMEARAAIDYQLLSS